MKESPALDTSNSLSKAAFRILVFYFLTSVLLSTFIFLRLEVSSPGWVKSSNVALYFCNYFATSVFASAWLLVYSISPPAQKSRFKRFTFFTSIAYFLLLYFAMILALPEYTFSWIPISLMTSVGATWHKTKNKLCSKKVAAVIILVSVSMPNVSAFICYNKLLIEASPITNETDKAIFISSYVSRITAFGYPFRAYNDWWKFLLSGAGHCGEMATATITFLNNLNMDAREIGLPREDHAFVEVKINETWHVIDPGYYPSEILTREQRATRRIAEFGAISYVIAYTDSSFVELTRYYVETDTIIIRVTYDEETLADAKIYLEHEFMGRTTRLPNSSSAFYTDGNGTVVLHMGALNYNTNAEPYETYYWIYVNDKNTGYNVTSTGTGKTHLIEIDVAEHPSMSIQNSMVK